MTDMDKKTMEQELTETIERVHDLEQQVRQLKEQLSPVRTMEERLVLAQQEIAKIDQDELWEEEIADYIVRDVMELQDQVEDYEWHGPAENDGPEHVYTLTDGSWISIKRVWNITHQKG